MRTLSLNTERLRRLLVEIRKRDLTCEVCLAEDVIGPGGGIYVRAQTPVTTRHITWFESRNPSSKNRPTFMEVEIHHRADSDPADVTTELAAELGLSSSEEGGDRRTRAREAADAVGGQAKTAAKTVRNLHQMLGNRYTRTQLSAVEVAGSFREFEREIRRLHNVVSVAVDEFLGGNALVMDFIVDYDLERPDVRHSVRVGALATELRIRSQAECCEDDAFRRELAHLFVAGFLHDSGMWNEPYCFAKDHEVRGAALVGAVLEEKALAEAVEKLVLFHSDWEALARAETVSFRRLSEGDLYERSFEAQQGAGGDCLVLSESERCSGLALALAERWVSDGDEALVRARTNRDVLDKLVQGVALPPSAEFVTALCNMEIECVAPRRAWVNLTGTVPVHSPRGTRTDRYVRTKVDGYTAGSLGHDDDASSPHLITLFAPGAGGKRRALTAIKPDDEGLWERRGAGRRWHIPAGRHRSLLSWEVTGFLTQEEYDTILAPYEAQGRRRGLLPVRDQAE